MHRLRVATVLTAIGLLVTGCAGEPDRADPVVNAPTTRVAPTTIVLTDLDDPFQQAGPRSFEVRGLELARDDFLGFAMHPNTAPATIVASSHDLEVCPANTAGRRGTPDRMWSDATGATTCVALDASGSFHHPFSTVPSFHLGVGLHPLDGRRQQIDHVRFDYEAVDSFFVLALPPLEAGRQSAEVVVKPSAARTVRVGAVDSDLRDLPGVSVDVRQDDGRVAMIDGTQRVHFGPQFGPVTLGRPVVIRVRNDTLAALSPGLTVWWA